MGLFDKLSGNKAAKKNTKKAVQQAGFDPFSFTGPFGSGSIDASGINIAGGAGSSLAPQFEGLAGNLLQRAGGQIPGGLGFSIQDVLGGAFGAGQAGAGFSQAAQQALGGVSSFNPDQFAADRFQQLQGLARPGEERAAGSLASRLFSQGRLGGEDTRAGRAFGELDQAQSQAETMRFLQSQDAANQQLLQRIGGATQLGQAGQNISGSAIQNFLAQIQGGIGTSQAQQGLFQTLLGGAGGATQGIQQAFAPSRDAIQSLLAGSGLQRQTDLAQAKIQAGFDPQAGAAALGSTIGGVVGGFL